MPEEKFHRTQRVGWLRAAVLGANDGIVSTASLLVGVAAAEVGRPGVLIAGVAGLVAGAMSMAAGEFVSVSSQADTEKADLARERAELETNRDRELAERLTREYGIASIPISVFCEQPLAGRYLRFCFAKTDAVLEQAGELLCGI